MNQIALDVLEHGVDLIICNGDATHFETIEVLQHLIKVLIEEDLEAALNDLGES